MRRGDGMMRRAERWKEREKKNRRNERDRKG